MVPSSDASPTRRRQRSRRRRALTIGGLGAVGLVAVAALVIGVARPDWYVRAWDASGITCGRDLSSMEAGSFDSPWSAWGEADHPDVDAAELDTHRERIDELAEELGFAPVGEIPSTTGFSDGEVSADQVSVEVAVQGDQLRLGVNETQGLRRLALIDPATGEASWQWNLDESRDARVEEQGDHLVLLNRILRGQNVFVGDQSTDLISIEKNTGEREHCRRFPGSPGYGASGTDAGLVVGTETWNPMVADEEQDEIGVRSVQQVTVPGLATGFSRAFPAIEYTRDGTPRERPHPLVTLSDGIFLTHAYTLGPIGGDDLFTAALHEDTEVDPDLVPVEAWDMFSGEKLWEHGAPGDRIAFVSGVPRAGLGADGEGAGILVAEAGETVPVPGDPDRGTVSVTLRMLDAEGKEVWEAEGTDVGDAFHQTDAERYLRVLGDIVLLHTSPTEVTALDARTGDALWSIQEPADQMQPLWLHQAFAVDGKAYLPGSGRRYFVDRQTGEDSPETASAIERTRALSVRPVGEEFLVVDTEGFGTAILRRAS